jgi:hypothetical protein
MTTERTERFIAPFNGPVEIGLRALTVLNEAFPEAYSLQRLIVFDYLIVHSDDIPDGPTGLHPKTPRRGGELLVRRGVLYEGLLLYQSRNLIGQRFDNSGVLFAATDHSAAFLDVLRTDYVSALRSRAEWLVDHFGSLTDSQLDALARENIGRWGAEFELESVLWEDTSE